MADAPGYRPLYRQVQDMFVARISDGRWSPGQVLPSEQTLASELGVSQGTVRKALDAMAADNLLERRQGKGTYVREVTPERSLFQFFRIARPGGARLTPESGPADVTEGTACETETGRLALAPGARVIRIVRARLIEGAARIVERIVLPQARFPGLTATALPNALYALYQGGYGISITTAEEELAAVAADADAARRLDVAPGTPLLEIDRIAHDLNGQPVEWRRSLCHTRDLVYAVTLR